MNKFTESLGVMGLGLSVIFAGLLLLFVFVYFEKYILTFFIMIFKGIKKGITSFFKMLFGKKNNKNKKPKKPVEQIIESRQTENGVPLEIRLAIIAAVSAYYDTQKTADKCEFTVRRIKRIV